MNRSPTDAMKTGATRDTLDPVTTEERSVITDIGGKRYRIASDDTYLNHIDGNFEPDMVALFDTLVESGHCVLDVGANIGCTSILFADRARHVYCFEPSPTTFQYLKQNIESAALPNITPVNLGLGRAGGTYELTYASDNRSGAFVSNHIQASAGHRVEQIRIVPGDDFVQAQGIARVDIVKIDVEGFEKDVIEGLGRTIARDQPVVALELNHWCLNAFQRISVPDFFDFLRGIFPYLYAVDKDDVRDLHDVNQAYHVMYHHIVRNFSYPTIVGAFHKRQLLRLSQAYGIDIPDRAVAH